MVDLRDGGEGPGQGPMRRKGGFPRAREPNQEGCSGQTSNKGAPIVHPAPERSLASSANSIAGFARLCPAGKPTMDWT